MKILIDIGHPAHVHYFKNIILKMRKNGHKVFVSARERYPVNELLKSYNIKYFNRGKGGHNKFSKLLYLLKADYKLLILSRKIKPDIFLSFGAVYLTHVAKLMRRPSIFIDDTDHARLNQKFYLPFATIILTPNTFLHDFGEKHIKFNGYMELCYLHPNRFSPDPSVLELLNVKRSEKYVIMRFVSWEASHDIGQSGLTSKMKRKLVSELSKYAKVFITSEGNLTDQLKKYQLKIPPEKIHDALAFATLFIGESPTMTTESAILGTPAICISSWACDCGNFKELREKYDLIYCFTHESEEIALKAAMNIIQDKDAKTKWKSKQKKLLSEKIDVTAFMVWFVENYPKSLNVMKENPNYQLNFI